MREPENTFGKTPSSTGEGPYSSIAEIKKQLQWAPKLYKIAALLAIAGIICTVIFFGGVSWSTNESFTQEKAIYSSVYLFFILTIELPLIASALRMPGTFNDNVHLLR